MMGQLPAQQNALFYEFCLENHIPEGHLLRQIDQFLDSNEGPLCADCRPPRCDFQRLLRRKQTLRFEFSESPKCRYC